jgi:hypothetical protein
MIPRGLNGIDLIHGANQFLMVLNMSEDLPCEVEVRNRETIRRNGVERTNNQNEKYNA